MKSSKRYIAIPRSAALHILFFETKKEVCEFFVLSQDETDKALEDGFPVFINGEAYFLDEDLD